MLFGDPKRADGEAAAHAFGPGDAIGLEAGGDGVEAVEVAGSAEAALDFVEQEEEVVFLSEGGEAFEEFPGGDIDAAFALDGFDEEGCGLVGEGSFDGVEIIEVDVFKPGEKGIETIVDFGLRGGRHGTDGAAVEGFVEGDDFVSFGGLAKSPGELEESVVGFGAGVGEEDFAGLLHDFLYDEFGKIGLRSDVVEIRAMHQRGRLCCDGRGQGRVAVTERAGGDAHAEIEIFTTVLIPHAGSFAAGHGEGKSAVSLEDVLLGLFSGCHESELVEMAF